MTVYLHYLLGEHILYTAEHQSVGSGIGDNAEIEPYLKDISHHAGKYDADADDYQYLKGLFVGVELDEGEAYRR